MKNQSQFKKKEKNQVEIVGYNCQTGKLKVLAPEFLAQRARNAAKVGNAIIARLFLSINKQSIGWSSVDFSTFHYHAIMIAKVRNKNGSSQNHPLPDCT
jgi:hypothetical protein